jgi:hypothetical protein
MLIDGISASSHLDSSGEVLNIAGHDISDLETGKGVINFEHNNDDPEDILGAIVYAKKIFKVEDCEDDRQRKYWELCRMPMVYIKAELFDEEGHPGAVAAAALIRYYAKRNEKLLVGFSVEGNTLHRDGNVLERSVGKKVALTLRPCNKSAVTGLLDDPAAKALIEKSERSSANKFLYEIDNIVLSDDPLKKSVDELLEGLSELRKTLTAGNYNVAPSQLTGGAALQVEDRSHKHLHRLKAKFRDWPRNRPLKEWLKAELPEVSKEYVDHFAEIAHEVSLKKGIKPPTRIGFQHSTNVNAHPAAKQLIDGLYMDRGGEFKPTEPHRNEITKLKNDAGQDVIIKKPRHFEEAHNEVFEPAHHATAYSDLAHTVLGMGEHVPVTNHFTVPGEQRPHQAMEYIKGGKSLLDPSTRSAYDKARENGSLHKMYLMDLILGGFHDRSPQNMVVHPNGNIMNVDNDETFTHDSPSVPYYLNGSDGGDILQDHPHHEALTWLKGINPVKLADRMKQLKMKPTFISETLNSLRELHSKEAQGKTLGELHSMVSNNYHEPFPEGDE